MRGGLLLCAALLAADVAQGRERRSLTLRFPRVTLPAGSNVETCYFVRIPATEAFLAGSWRIRHQGSKGNTRPSHFLTYLYTGERLSEFPVATVVPSRGCLDLGPSDRDRRVLIATGADRRVVRAYPSGVGVALAPVPSSPGGAPEAIGLLLDAAWTNGEPRARTVSTKVVLKAVAKKRLHRVAQPFSDRSADAGILVPPFAEASTAERVDARWTAPSDRCVLGLSGQMHQRGRCLGIDLLGADGVAKTPPGSPPNPCEPDRREQLFVGADYTDPGALAFSTPLAVRAGEALRWACWHDNGARRAPVRLGCEATPGIPPGAVGAPAPSCTLAVAPSAECGGTQACVPANAVAGPGVEDEVCGLTGLVYDAAANGSCDVSGG
jgi:hypothetical protein